MEENGSLIECLAARAERLGADKDSTEMRKMIVLLAGTITNNDVESCDQGIAMLSLLQEALEVADLSEDAKSHWHNVVEWQMDVCATQRESLLALDAL